MSTPIPEWAMKTAQECMVAHGTAEAIARALMAEREAADERAAKIAEEREAILRKQANELFEGRDQGSAILIRERAIEATEIASAIRDRSKT